MAPLCCMQPHIFRFSTLVCSSPLQLQGLKRSRNRNINPKVVCCKTVQPHQTPSCGDNFEEEIGTKRRLVLLGSVFAAISSIPTVSLAETEVLESSRLYTDDVNKFKIVIPQDWEVGTGETDGVRSLIAFYPQKAASTSNVSVVISGLGADYTRLESFGKVDAFAETLVGGLDRSWQRPPGVAAKLVDSRAANGLYYIEYTLQKPGESRRTLFSVLGVANNGWYNRLYTLTGQFVDEESEEYASKVKKAILSFRFI